MGQCYDFQQQLAWSEGFLDSGIASILVSRIPECYEAERADSNNDRQGTDYWAKRHNLPSLSIDVKVRSKDYSLFGQDDLALETWSVKGQKIGWTRDPSKRTDFVMWFWQDTERFFIVSFPALCKVFCHLWEKWASKYKCETQHSERWDSECVFVPRDVVRNALDHWASGMIPEQDDEAEIL